MKTFKDYITEYPLRKNRFTLSLNKDEYRNIKNEIKQLEKDELLELKKALEEAIDYINSHSELLI